MAGLARHRGVIALAALAAALLTARLGWWQQGRAEQKLATQALLEARARLPPLQGAAALADNVEAAALQHHRRATLTGQWLAQHTVYLDNRPMNGRSGFFVLTPLGLADGSAVLVQRGWLPRDFQERTRIAAPPTPAGPLTLQGRIAPGPSRLYEFDSAAAPSGPIRQNLDLPAYARETGLALRPFTLLQDEAVAADGLQRDWPAASFGAAKNQGYAWQWFGLSALIVILYVWFQLIQPLRRR